MARVSEQIVALLGVAGSGADPMAQFEKWVAVRTARVQSAAAEGQPGLRLELAQLKEELMGLESVESAALRQSEALWLDGLISLVAEALTESPGIERRARLS